MHHPRGSWSVRKTDPDSPRCEMQIHARIALSVRKSTSTNQAHKQRPRDLKAERPRPSANPCHARSQITQARPNSVSWRSHAVNTEGLAVLFHPTQVPAPRVPMCKSVSCRSSSWRKALQGHPYLCGPPGCYRNHRPPPWMQGGESRIDPSPVHREDDSTPDTSSSRACLAGRRGPSVESRGVKGVCPWYVESHGPALNSPYSHTQPQSDARDPKTCLSQEYDKITCR